NLSSAASTPAVGASTQSDGVALSSSTGELAESLIRKPHLIEPSASRVSSTIGTVSNSRDASPKPLREGDSMGPSVTCAVSEVGLLSATFHDPPSDCRPAPPCSAP